MTVLVEAGLVLAVSLVSAWEVCWHRPYKAARRAEEAEDAEFWAHLKGKGV